MILLYILLALLTAIIWVPLLIIGVYLILSCVIFVWAMILGFFVILGSILEDII